MRRYIYTMLGEENPSGFDNPRSVIFQDGSIKHINNSNNNISNNINPPPILSTKTYTANPENRIWQIEEAKRIYINSTKERQHGTYGQREGGGTFEWMKDFRKPLSRTIEDIRPPSCRTKFFDSSSLTPVSVIIIFCNEMLELLLRSVHSVLDRTPPPMLREILLIDDFSDQLNLLSLGDGGTGELQDYINYLPKTKYIRLKKRSGIVGARMAGIHASLSDIFVIFDSHIEVTEGWLYPLVVRIEENATRVLMPVIDGIDQMTWEPIRGGIGCVLGLIWKLTEHAFNPNERNPARQSIPVDGYVSSPTMAGGLLAANKEFFLEIGGYDMGMSFWGTENVELSFRLWQCGGSIECTECSHVHHLFGGGKHYSVGGGSIGVNKMRTMAVWMDGYADLAWNVLGRPKVDIGDISYLQSLRRDLHCRNFKWYMSNVWPESDVVEIPRDVPYMGPLTNVASDLCLTSSPSLGSCVYSSVMYFNRSLHIVRTTNDEMCLTLSSDGQLSWNWCEPHKDLKQEWILFSLPGSIKSSAANGGCLSAKKSHNDEGGAQFMAKGDWELEVVKCGEGGEEGRRQVWSWTPYNPPDNWTPPPVALRRNNLQLL